MCKLVIFLILTYTVLPFHHSCCSSHRSMTVLFSLALLEIYNRYTVVLIDIHDACEQNHRKIKRESLIVRVNVVLNRTVVADSDWRFDNLCGSHLQSLSELCHVSWWYYTLVIDLIGQLCRDVIGRLSVKPWCYWLWRLVISDWCVSICLLSQLWHTT